jgi:very-short-patch-repair endonuclease
MGEVVDEDPPWSLYCRDPLVELIERQHGIVARWQALRHLSAKALKHRLTSGRWHAVRRGIYRTYGGPLTLRQRHWIAVLAAGPSIKGTGQALLGGISALQVHGLRGITSDWIHVAVSEYRRFTPPAGVAVHRARLTDEDRHPCAQPPTTTLGRAVIDAAAWARSDDEARLIIAVSFQQRLVTEPEIAQTLARMASTRRRPLVISTARDAAGGSHSLGELDLIDICRQHRLPLPNRQVQFTDSLGRRRYLDAVFDDWAACLEIDGAHHDDDLVQHWDDLGRDADLLFAGYRLLRIPVREIREQRSLVAAKIRKLLTVAGWRPGAA